MEEERAGSDIWQVKASIREAIRKLTDDKGSDSDAALPGEIDVPGTRPEQSLRPHGPNGAAGERQNG
jgi:hypothetical protein